MLGELALPPMAFPLLHRVARVPACHFSTTVLLGWRRGRPITQTSLAMSIKLRPRPRFSFSVVRAQTFTSDKADKVPLRPPVQNSHAVLRCVILGIATSSNTPELELGKQKDCQTLEAHSYTEDGANSKDPPDTPTLSFQPVKLPPLYSGGIQQVEILGVDAYNLQD